MVQEQQAVVDQLRTEIVTGDSVLLGGTASRPELHPMTMATSANNVGVTLLTRHIKVRFDIEKRTRC